MTETWKEWVIPSRAGDAVSFRKLMEYCQRILLIFYRTRGASVEDSQELTQDTLLQMHQSLPSLTNPAAFHAWLYTIAQRQWANRLERKPRTLQTVPLDKHGDFAARASEHGESREFPEPIRSLPEEDRLLLALRFVEALNSREISERLQLSMETIRKRLSRLCHELRARYKTGASE